MQVKPDDKHDCSAKARFARQNYYFGKMMTVRDFQDEQKYLNEKRWLLNRYGLGWGVLCGLKVKPDPDNACQVILEPGVALDKYGNEIIVSEPCHIDLRKCAGEKKQNGNNTGHLYCIAIEYRECLTDPAPIPVEDCGVFDTECVYNRTAESFKIVVSCDPPHKHPGHEAPTCETECWTLLRHPGGVVSHPCPSQEKCQPVPLACVCYVENAGISEHDIDNVSFRKVAYSNELLFDLIACLRDELGDSKASRIDRRKFVPLLANTIPGLRYQDGKNTRIMLADFKHPFRLTSDGSYLWGTDLAGNKLFRINRQTHRLAENWAVELPSPGYGIAYDGRYLWISHNHEGQGKLSRVSACDPEKHWTFDRLPWCEHLPKCKKFSGSGNEDGLESLEAYPQELVYHDHLLYVSHGWPPEEPGNESSGTEQARREEKSKHKKTEEEECSTFYISIINTRKSCLVAKCCVEFPENNAIVPDSPILAMVSDGDKVWFTFMGHAPAGQGYGRPRPVVSWLRYHDGECRFGPPCILKKGERPERMTFDGTSVWLSHNDGLARIDVATGDISEPDETDKRQTALAYTGGDHVWSTQPGRGEAHVNKFDIYSAEQVGEIEIIEYHDREGAEYEIMDMQFDGAFLYVAAYLKEPDAEQKGIIHRLLP